MTAADLSFLASVLCVIAALFVSEPYKKDVLLLAIINALWALR